MPWIWLVAGPNGSGKSTAVEGSVLEALSGEQLPKLNPDKKTRELLEQNPRLPLDLANRSAANAIDAEVDGLISSGVSFVVETVLSTDKYKPKVEKAKAGGFNFGLIYVILATPEDNVARVAQRVAAGGHDVPQEKIIKRWENSILNLPWFVERADFCLVFDNTSPGSVQKPVLLASKSLGGKLKLVKPGYHFRIDAALSPLL